MLTLSYINILKSHLRARVTDQHFSIQCKHNVHLCEVNHTSDHITRLPLSPKGLHSQMPTLGLKKEAL